ncbi:MAG: type II secretion system F family protein [Planctomycetaceae bacterium]
MAIQTDIEPRINPRPQFAGILREDLQFASGQDDGATERINGWFDQLVMQSGLQTAPATILFLCVTIAVGLGGTAFVVQENLLAAAMAALIGSMLPIMGLIFQRNRRQTAILAQAPGAIDALSRAARTGRSLEQCFVTMTEEVEPPLKNELQLCVRSMQLGMPFPEAVRKLPERTGLTSLNVWMMALKVHYRAGGDLVMVMDRLSRTMRDRILFLGRLRAATTSSRATAILMLVIPPCILAFFAFRDPEYFSNLMSSSWGRGATITAVVLQIIGSIWVRRILKTSAQS